MPKHSNGRSAPSYVVFPAVCLGASASGLTALRQFFEALPAATGAAYVVVLHLPPSDTGDLYAVLRQATSMPVVPVTAALTLQSDHVYVVAPSCTVTLNGDHLSVCVASESENEREQHSAKNPLQQTVAEYEVAIERLRTRNADLTAALRAATETRLAEEKLNSASQSALEEVKRRQDEFLAVVSHELKHPLNLISANAELIARSTWASKEPNLAHAAATISRTVTSQAQIIDDLLDVSRVRTGQLSIARAAVDLTDAVRRICNTVRDEARRSDIDLVVSLPDRPVAIEADLTRIEQVLWNLIGNALKYTNRDGKIAVALRADYAIATLTISDNGIGIDPTMLPHIFEMFKRGQSTCSEQSGGLGIGLSLVKELVAIHGGRVSVHSDGLGRGATFTVELPLLSGQANAAQCSGRRSAFLRDTEIVLVDDDRETVEAFKMLLEMEGASVIVATAGDDALRILDDRSPSFILSDLGMPGMSGVELIEAVRKRNRLANVKAIALSGFGRDSDVQSALRAGFDAHLTKPVTLDALLDAMARLQAR